MAKSTELNMEKWNDMLVTYHTESDRGAAILAGSFIEHVLGQYLRYCISDKKIADDLFAPMGPLSNFSQRINIAYAFDFIPKYHFKDLDTIRRIRNHFAHHPLDSTFETNEIKQRCSKFSMFDELIESNVMIEERKYRNIYLITCAMICASLMDKIGDTTHSNS